MRSYSKQDISLSRLRELLHYDRSTGIWTWRVNRGPHRAGAVAGTLNCEGYIQIRVDRKLYMAHVLAWFYSFEQWPRGHVDHENRVKTDNWINNLRQCTLSQNFGNTGKRKNNTTGFKGVTRHGKRFRAEIAHVKLGTFDTAEQAAAAYEQAARERYGIFAATA